MADHIRRISVHVDEPRRGEFFWVLMESRADPAVWNEIKSSAQAYSTYGLALSDGVSVLEKLGSPAHGPRIDRAEDEAVDPVG